MYLYDQTYYEHALFFAQHNKLMKMEQPKGTPPLAKDSPFAGNLKDFGAEPLGPGSARFTMNAPDAKQVQVAGMEGTTMFGRGRIDLHPVGDGSWTVDVDGLEPGFQYIRFLVDGMERMNPKAPFGHGYGRVVNFVEVPDTPENDAFFMLRDVPHGSVSNELYFSTVTGMWRNCYVYLPPKYFSEPEKRYPVLYLQHGGGENETCWLWQGKINLILDNLIAAGKCEEMLVVMNMGYAFRADEPYRFLPGDLGKVLHDDCIPMIDGKFRTIPDADHRAMAGLSMGSYQTSKTVTDYPDMIHYVGLLSGGLISKAHNGAYGARPANLELLGDMIYDQPEKLKKMKLVFVATGTEEPSAGNLKLVEDLRRETGYEGFKTYATKGVHEWRVWRHSACAFVQELFRD